jgi:hypothetical protein
VGVPPPISAHKETPAIVNNAAGSASSTDDTGDFCGASRCRKAAKTAPISMAMPTIRSSTATTMRG